MFLLRKHRGRRKNQKICGTTEEHQQCDQERCMLSRKMQTMFDNPVQTRVTFGLFEADLKTGELWKAGSRVKLQALPFKVLGVLVNRAGQVVTREELQAGVWGPDVIVDFEHALSNAVKKLREALGDSAINPRFIETLSRRGFRFIAPVGFIGSPIQPAGGTQPAAGSIPPALSLPTISAAVVEAVDERVVVSKSNMRRRVERFGILTLGLLAGFALRMWLVRSRPMNLPRVLQITQDGTIYSPKVLLLGTLSALATDGSHMFTPANQDGQVVLRQVSLSTGVSLPLPLPSQIGVPEVEDISPDGTQLLLRSNLAAASQQPLWIVPIDGGSAFRVSDVMAQAATWMPDGRNVLYASGNRIMVVSLENGRSTLMATLPGRAFWPRWSRDGNLLRFTIIDAVHHTSSLWQIVKGQNTAQQILQSWDGADGECCGIWTADGKSFVFEATKEGGTDLWKVDSSLHSEPERITNGPLNFKAPLSGRSGGEVFFVGQDIHSRLERYDAARKQFVPVDGFLASGDHVNYSRDGRWVAWTDSNNRLWRARSDGSERVVLTPASMQVFTASWSPDDSQIAFMARAPKKPWQIFTIRAEGGTPERITEENRNLGDPTFSADGKYITIGIIPELMGESDASNLLGIMKLATHTLTTLPHSEGLYSPKWSPDGHYIAALTLEGKRLMLYDTKSATWKMLPAIPADHPVWSSDSKSLFFRARVLDKKPIYRISVPEGRADEVVDLTSFHAGSMTLADFAGVTPDNVPLMRVEVSSGNLYSLDLGH